MSDFVQAFWLDRSDRERLRLTGSDRAKFLHNLCTNEIKNLKVGRGCEMFVTSPQGKTIGYFTVLARDDHLDLSADPGSLSLVMPHFAKYSVFDDVELTNVRAESFEIYLSGNAATSWLQMKGIPTPEMHDLAQTFATWGDAKLQVVRESPFGTEGFTVTGPLAVRDATIESLGTLDCLSIEDAEGLRIEAGTPRFGADITLENLPQEIGRDTRTISFVKGCYLGQETVARLDALGHVNKLMRGIRVVSGEIPACGAEVLADGKPAGIVTSSGLSPRTGRGVALGILKVKAAPIGQAVTWNGGEGIVSDLPMS